MSSGQRLGNDVRVGFGRPRIGKQPLQLSGPVLSKVSCGNREIYRSASRKIHLYWCEANEEVGSLYHSEADPLFVRIKRGSRKELGFLAPSGERKSQDHYPL
jgi:hypothetical protein